MLKSNETKQLTIKDYINKLSIKGKHPSWAFAHIRNFNRSWNRDLRHYACQVCRYEKHIELAHIVAIKDFPIETKLSVVNNPNNIYVLCPNHHWELDNNCLNLDSIHERSESTKIKRNNLKPFIHFCSKCAKPQLKPSKSTLCSSCFTTSSFNTLLKEKIKWPTKQELQELVWKFPCSILASQLGISGNAIGKRCKKLSIPKPPRGYWEKLHHSK